MIHLRDNNTVIFSPSLSYFCWIPTFSRSRNKTCDHWKNSLGHLEVDFCKKVWEFHVSKTLGRNLFSFSNFLQTSKNWIRRRKYLFAVFIKVVNVFSKSGFVMKLLIFTFIFSSLQKSKTYNMKFNVANMTFSS